jgi:hypothetical protein
VSAGLAPAFTAVADAVTVLMPVVGSLVDTVVSGMSSIGRMVLGTFDEIIAIVVTGMSVAEFAFTNLGAVVDFVMIESHIAVLAFVGGVEHFFTASLPAYLSWFGDNWREVFFSAFDLATTVFINIGNNIRNAWTAIIDFISGNSEGLAFVWTPLTEGFVSTVKALPDIPERAITGLEAQLRSESKVMGDALGSGLNATIDKNMDKVAKVGESPEPVAKVEIKGKAGDFAAAAEMGTQAAYTALIQSIGNKSDNKIAKEQLAVSKEQLKLMRRTSVSRDETPIFVGAIA